MGTLIDSNYKTIYLTPEEDGTLQIFMKGKKINKEMFKNESEKNKVLNISMVAGELTQKEFDELIQVIKLTIKNTFLSFMPIRELEESIAHAHKRYANEYRNNGQKSVRHFPDNLYINNVFIEYDEDKGVVKKRGL